MMKGGFRFAMTGYPQTLSSISIDGDFPSQKALILGYPHLGKPP